MAAAPVAPVAAAPTVADPATDIPKAIEALKSKISEYETAKSNLSPANSKFNQKTASYTKAIKDKKAELKIKEKELAALTKTPEPALTVAVKTETPITFDTIDTKAKAAERKVAVITAEQDAIKAELGPLQTSVNAKNKAKIPALLTKQHEIEERLDSAVAEKKKLDAIKEYADLVNPFSKNTDIVNKLKTLRTTFKQAEAAQKLKATAGTDRALRQAKEQYKAAIDALTADVTAMKTKRDAMDAARATFQETPDQTDLYNLIKDIVEYKAATVATVATIPGAAPVAAGAAPVAAGAAPVATGAAPAALTTPSTTPTSIPGSSTTDATAEINDVTFTFLDKTFTVENDFTGDILKPKQKQFLLDMNILPLVESVLQPPALLSILENIVKQPTCKVDYGLSMMESCNPMRTLISLFQEAMWSVLINDPEVLSKTKSGSASGSGSGSSSGSSSRSGSSGFTTITITLSLNDLFAAMS